MTNWPSCSTSGSPSTSPQRAAQIILDAVRKKKARVLVGTDAKVLDLHGAADGFGLSAAVLGSR